MFNTKQPHMCSRIECLSNRCSSERKIPINNSKGTVLFTYLLSLITTSYDDGSRALNCTVRDCKFALLDDLKDIIRKIVENFEIINTEDILQQILIYFYNIELFLQILGIKNKTFTDKIIKWKKKLESIVKLKDDSNLIQNLDDIHTMMYFVMYDIVNCYYVKVGRNKHNGIKEEGKVIDLNIIFNIHVDPIKHESTKNKERTRKDIPITSKDRPVKSSWFFGLFKVCGL